MKHLFLIFTLFAFNANADSPTSSILVNSDILNYLSYDFNKSFQVGGVVTFKATDEQLEEIQHIAHEEFNRCGGYELLNDGDEVISLLDLGIQIAQNHADFMYFSPSDIEINFKPEILLATENLSADNLASTVAGLSNFETRSSRSKNPNEHVKYMKNLVDDIIANSPLDITSELVKHRRTKQYTLKARIEGYKFPDEVIILGGHLDSTSGFFQAAPGADDNASGSANVLEIFRVLAGQKTPERSIEFFWYAAEEVGLVGSAEIAKDYKKNDIDVIAVMQLDMTGFTGSGVFNIANVTDFTSPWLQQTLLELNRHYAGAIVHESKCGYGCSDHASWYRQGFNTVFPIEAKFKESNKHIHSKRDTMDKLNFEHSLMFAKLGLSFAMELANSELRGPN